MADGRIAYHAAIEVECVDRLIRVHPGNSGGVNQLTAPAPDLEGKVVERIVSIGKSREYRSMQTSRWISQKSRCFFKLLPRGRWIKIAPQCGPMSRAQLVIREKVFTIDEALGAVVPRQGG